MQDLLPKRLRIGLIDAEQDEASRRQQGTMAAKVRQLVVGQANEVGDPHRVEDAARGGFRGGQVGVAVEIEQAGVRANPPHAGNDTDGDGAISAEDQRNGAVGDHTAHDLGDLSRRSKHGREVTAGRVRVVVAVPLQVVEQHVRGDVVGVPGVRGVDPLVALALTHADLLPQHPVVLHVVDHLEQREPDDRLDHEERQDPDAEPGDQGTPEDDRHQPGVQDVVAEAERVLLLAGVDPKTRDQRRH